MESLNGIYPDMSSCPPLHEWECIKCGALLELPTDDKAPRICEDCEEEEE